MEVRINGDRINGLFHLLVNGVDWGERSPTDPITFDPNFHPVRDIQVGGCVFVFLFLKSPKDTGGKDEDFQTMETTPGSMVFRS